jgi:hypothetical protein
MATAYLPSPGELKQIEELQDFRTNVVAWMEASSRAEQEPLRVLINRNVGKIIETVTLAGCRISMTVSPPPAIGGIVMQNVDPFAYIFDDVWGISLNGKVLDMLDQAIGVIESGKFEERQQLARRSPQGAVANDTMSSDGDERLLAELDAILRDEPPRAEIRHQTVVNERWFGRAAAAIHRWNSFKGVAWEALRREMHSSIPGGAKGAMAAVSQLISMLHEARFDLQHRLGHPMGVSIAQGQPYHFFDEVRKIVETARSDLFFIDRYLEADFVSRYMPYVMKGTTVRLLAREGIPRLKPAIELFASQSGLTVQIRSTQNIHERCVIVDQTECYLSGDSFKDGAKNQPATLLRVTDAFDEVRARYEAVWQGATIERA